MNEPASTKIATGGLVLLIGLGVTIASMAASARGGVVIVAWGAMLFGAVRLVSGLLHLGPRSAADDIITDVTEEVRVLVAIMSAMILDPQMPTSEELAVIRAALNDASAAFGYVVRPFDNAVIREAALAMQTEPEGIAATCARNANTWTTTGRNSSQNQPLPCFSRAASGQKQRCRS